MEEKGKKLGLWNIIGLGLGGAIGTGIFLLLGYGIAYTGRSIVLVCAVGCFFMLLAYWYNLAMPTMFVLNGGDYSQKQMLMNPFMSGMSAMMTIVNAFAMAGYVVAMTDYLSILFPSIKNFEIIFNVVLMTLFFLTTIKGSRVLTLFENAVTIVLVVALVIFVGFGVTKVDSGAFFSNSDGGFWLNGFGGFMSAIAVMGWACQGTTMAPISMTAVTKNPKHTIPKGIILITVILAVIYALMAYVASGVLPYEQVAGQNISVTAEAIFPTGLYLFFVVGGGVCAIASSLLGGLGMYRYPAIKIAEDGWLPKVFKKTTKDGYPYVFYILFYLVSIFPLITGMSLDALVSLVMIPTMLINMYMNFACMKLPEQYPEQWEKRSIKFPVWLWKVCSILGVLCAGVVAYNLFVDLTTTDAIICVIILAVMAVLTIIRLKQGAVTKEALDASRQKVIDEALLDYKEE